MILTWQINIKFTEIGEVKEKLLTSSQILISIFFFCLEWVGSLL